MPAPSVLHQKGRNIVTAFLSVPFLVYVAVEAIMFIRSIYHIKVEYIELGKVVGVTWLRLSEVWQRHILPIVNNQSILRPVRVPYFVTSVGFCLLHLFID